MDIMDELANSSSGIYKKTRFTMVENNFILNPNYTVYEKFIQYYCMFMDIMVK